MPIAIDGSFEAAWPEGDRTRLRPASARGPSPSSLLDAPLEAVPSDRRYGAGKLLGEGGMGQVVEVVDPTLGRKVAMKVMHAEVARTAEGERRFLREARIQGRLEHPAVVPVYELGRAADGLPYFTMKQVQGLTLAEVIDRVATGDAELEARFPRRRLLTAFVQVCLAVDFAHSRGVLHRDLKPANIMLGDFGDVHLLDWGLAQMEGELGPARDLEQALANSTRGGSVFGTPGYMAPEQVSGERVDQRADVYSLGAILFELLALSPMHPGSASQRIATTLRGGQNSPRALAPYAQVPPELDALVVEATQVGAASRTTSARALADAVERYLDGDRDQLQRLALAAEHLARARPLVEGLETASGLRRESAMRELTGALALDPGNAAALELLRRLISHVPATLPPEAEVARRSAEESARGGTARAFAVRLVMWLALAPLIWAMGPVSIPHGCALAVAVVGALALALWASRRRARSRAGICGVMAAVGLVLAGVTSLFGSFVLVPCLAATSTVMFASHLQGRTRALAIAVSVVAVLAPFGLEELGVLSPAYELAQDQIRILPRLVHFPPGLTRLVLVLATVSSLVVPGVLAGRLRDRLAQAEQRLFLMAWHLERLGKRAAA